MTNRKAGVLLPLFSLPGPYGCGVCGAEAADFIKRIADMGFSAWQMLPLTPVDAREAYSPYAGYSAFAGNPMYIDPRDLVRRGLVTEAEEAACRSTASVYFADYPLVAERHEALLRLAFSRMDGALRAQVEAFTAAHDWLPAFARFCAARRAHNGAPWWQWPAQHKCAASALADKALDDEALFQCFTQYLFFSAWEALRRIAEAAGIALIGDMPMYVGLDSADVWGAREQFLLDAEGKPCEVAGVPPDYFSEDGQLWGNPLYDWAFMDTDGYRWWRARIDAALSMYDIVRIDHFRAFAAYWSVPATAKTAKEGQWKDGPGMALFGPVLETVRRERIIAEDLGAAGEEVTQLLADTGFAGIRVLQFAFEGDDSEHLPHNYPQNCAAYLGTHDNNTMLSWLFEATPKQREAALSYCRFGGGDWGVGGAYSPSVRACIETLWASHADTVILPLQDMAGFGVDTRTNVPGTMGGANWRFRVSQEALEKLDTAWFKALNKRYFRGVK